MGKWLDRDCYHIHHVRDVHSLSWSPLLTTRCRKENRKCHTRWHKSDHSAPLCTVFSSNLLWSYRYWDVATVGIWIHVRECARLLSGSWSSAAGHSSSFCFWLSLLLPAACVGLRVLEVALSGEKCQMSVVPPAVSSARPGSVSHNEITCPLKDLQAAIEVFE